MPANHHPAASVVERARRHELVIGYWIVLDSPVSTERIALAGYDYIAVDMQHGLMGYSGMLANLTAIDAAHGPAGVVRVEANSASAIGKALDAGARAVIVPLVDSAADAEQAVRSARYPSRGARSYGPMRAGLRVGPVPSEADEAVLVLCMIETPEGLDNVDSILAVKGVDGVYIGPSDLALAVGARFPGDPDVQEAFDAAVETVLAAAKGSGKIAAIHSLAGHVARQRIEQGFTFITIASDLNHLEAAARDHLADARGDR